MSADAPEAVDQDSKDNVGVWARRGLAIAGVVGALLLLFSTFATIIHIDAFNSTGQPITFDNHVSGWHRHGAAFVFFALIALMALGMALRGSQPAMGVVLLVGLVALVLTISRDAAHIHDTGTVGSLYDDARAAAGFGFYEETLGAILVILAGGGLLLLEFYGFEVAVPAGPGETPRDASDERAPEPPAPQEPEPGPETGPAAARRRRAARESGASRKPLDWFD